MEMSIDTWTSHSIKQMNNWVRFDHDCLRPERCEECDRNQEKTRKLLFTSGGNVIINTNSDANATLLNLNSSSFKIVINVPFFDYSLEKNFNVEIICTDRKSESHLGNSDMNLRALENSGWYWQGIDSEASNRILCRTKPGTFMVRQSSDPSYLYSLSVQTERGPTSVRLHCRNGKFSLDSDKKLADLLPQFETVISLVQYYVNGGSKLGKQVWIDPSGQTHSRVRLTKPMRREVGSLQHLSRLVINKNNLPKDLSPAKINNYLNEYTYTL